MRNGIAPFWISLRIAGASSPGHIELLLFGVSRTQKVQPGCQAKHAFQEGKLYQRSGSQR